MKTIAEQILDSHHKFDVNLEGKKVLTEAASGNYVCTSLLSALAGADVFAIVKDSKFGSILHVRNEVILTAKKLMIENHISIVESLDQIDLGDLDVITNTGFVRPINKTLIDCLKPSCVISLMWEPWEYRPLELDLNYAVSKGIKVYGTNESDPRLHTMTYIGLIVLKFLLLEKRTPNNSNIILIGSQKFISIIHSVLKNKNFEVSNYETRNFSQIDISKYDIIVVSEIVSDKLIIGNSPDALIATTTIRKDQLVIHISGNVDFKDLPCKHYPEKPAPINHMSYTTDFVDPRAVFDLHAAGLKVAEGMLESKRRDLNGFEFKKFMETNYPAQAFESKKYW